MNLIVHTDSQQDISQNSYTTAINDVIPQFPTSKRTIASSKNIYYKHLGPLTIEDYVIFSRLPDHPFWSHIEKSIDFKFADELFSNLYSPYSKRPYAPSLLLKIHLVKTLENLNDSELETLLMFDLGIRRFIGVPMSYKGVDPAICQESSSHSYAYLFRACFDHILTQAYQHRLWGNRGEKWLKEAILPYTLDQPGQHRQMVRALLTFVQHMKRYNPPMFQQALKTLRFGDWFQRIQLKSAPELRAVAYSKLIAHACASLFWLEQESNRSHMNTWSSEEHMKQSVVLQESLIQLLNGIVRV